MRHVSSPSAAYRRPSSVRFRLGTVSGVLRRPRNLRGKLLAVLLTLAIAAGAVASTAAAILAYRDGTRALQSKLEQVADVEASALAAPLFNYDIAAIELILLALALDRDVSHVDVRDGSRSILAQAGSGPRILTDRTLVERRDIFSSVPAARVVLGEITIVFNRQRLHEEILDQLLRHVALLIALTAALTAGALAVFRRVVGIPLERMLVSIRSVHSDAPRKAVQWASGDEMGTVVDAYNQMLLRETAAKAALHESEARFRDYAEIASDWFWETDPDHRFVFISDRISSFGIDRESRIGIARWDGAVDLDEGKWRTHRETLDRHEPFRDFIYKIRPTDGSLRFVSVSGKPLFRSDGRFVGYRGGGRDVTEDVVAAEALREAKRQAEVASRAKSNFLANMSHELRTPLNAIIGFADIMRSSQLGARNLEQWQSYADDIYRSGEHLLAIINDVLDVAKIESGRGQLVEENFHLAKPVEQALTLVSVQAAQAGVTLCREEDPDLPPVRADAHALLRILLNLLSNGVKFTPPGGRVTVRLRRESGAGINISVIDTGIGISQFDIAKLGQPFAQIDSSYNRKYHGAGLGLALVRSLIELHGGTFHVESVLKQGTTATVRLPASRVVSQTKA